MSSEALRISERPAKEKLHISTTPGDSGCVGAADAASAVPPLFHLPSPIITRRTRTYSASERAARNPVMMGKVKYFCRYKGHGYITPDDGGEDLFVHVSDVDGDFVPREGDQVSYRLCPIPPKNERFQAVHVNILNMTAESHEKWELHSPLGSSPTPFSS